MSYIPIKQEVRMQNGLLGKEPKVGYKVKVYFNRPEYFEVIGSAFEYNKHIKGLQQKVVVKPIKEPFFSDIDLKYPPSKIILWQDIEDIIYLIMKLWSE